jgi:hypothetical protein
MSLTFDITKSSIQVANLYSNGKLKDTINYIDTEDLKEDEKALTKIRLNIQEDEFFPAITDFKKENMVNRWFICGESGCGKTSFLIRLINEFHKKYPKSKILFFSSKIEDKNIDAIPFVERVKIDDDILTNPYTLTEMSAHSKPTLTVWDDIEDFPTRKITKEIERLLNEVLRNGRSFGIYSAYTHHQPADYIHTRNLLFEATHAVIFPKRAGKDAYNYFLEKKLNINKKTLNMINSLKSNFVCIKKNIPKCVIADKYILLL